MRLRLRLNHVCREQTVLARTVTWCASLAAFCKGGTKSPQSPLCLIMLIMDSNSIIAGNECKSIVLPPGDNCKKIWLSFFVTRTKRFFHTFCMWLTIGKTTWETHPAPLRTEMTKSGYATLTFRLHLAGRELNVTSPSEAVLSRTCATVG